MHTPKPIAAALTYGAFPVVFGGAMGLGVYGVGQGWNPVATAMGLTAAVVLLLRARTGSPLSRRLAP
jgi:hypothetical protein